MKKRIVLLAIALFSLSMLSKAQTVDPDKKKGTEGTVTFKYRGETVTYTTVRAADGQVWLKQNLGSSQVASSVSDKESFGDFYAWGRWTDGHELREGTPIKAAVASPNNPKGLNKDGANPYYTSVRAAGYWWFKGEESDTWDKAEPKDATEQAGVDPCKQLGKKWRMPTMGEWEKVLKAEDITSVKTAFDSNLKIPMAGYRMGKTGEIGTQNKMARLWTSTAAKTGNAHLVNIVFKGVDIPAYSRSGGLSVRCINK